MNPELVQILLQGGSTAVLIWVVSMLDKRLATMQEESKADRLWMQNLLLYLVKRDEPEFDPQVLPGHPPSRTDMPTQK